MTAAKDDVELRTASRRTLGSVLLQRLLDFRRQRWPAREGVVRDDDLALLSERPLARRLLRRVVQDVVVDVVVELVDR